MMIFFHYDPRVIPEIISKNFIVQNSWVFVEFFFVLSGFIISHRYSFINNKNSFIQFIKKRIARLYPLLFYSVLVFFLVESIASFLFGHLVNTKETFNEYLVQTLNSILMLNSTPFFYLFGSNGIGTNPVTWSISSEMISYLIFGYVMLLKKFKNVMMIVLILTSIIFRYYYFNLPPTVLNIEFMRGITSFFIGVLIYRTKRVKINYIFEYIAFCLLIIQMYFMKYNLLDERFLEIVLLNIIFSLLIFVFVNSDGGITRVLNSNLLQYLGKISYSIYLNHLIVITVFHRIIFQIFNITNNQINQILVFMSSIIITIIYSNFTYKLFEKKLSSKLRTYLIK